MKDLIFTVISLSLKYSVIALLFGIPTMLLWNWLMTSIFGIREILFIEAVGIQAIAYLVFPKTTNTKESYNVKE